MGGLTLWITPAAVSPSLGMRLREMKAFLLRGVTLCLLLVPLAGERLPVLLHAPLCS